MSSIKEFLDNIDKLLTRRQKNRLKNISDFSDEEKKEFKNFMEIAESIIEGQNKEKSFSGSLSPKVSKLIIGCIIPIKQKTFLAEMVLSYLISYQEAFIKDYVKEILIVQRDILKSKKTLTFEEICGFESMDSLIVHMAQKEVDKILYGDIDEQADYIEKLFGLSLYSEFAEWNIVREASYRRNLIIHNRGITNKTYCLKTGHRKADEHLNTESDYVLNTKSYISFIDFIHLRISEKFCFSPTKNDNVAPRNNGDIVNANAVTFSSYCI